MGGSVNKVIIVGNLGRNPEVRSFQNGGKVCNLRIATTEKWKDRDGNQKERTEWHSVAIMDDNLISLAEQYLRKGSSVYLEGQLETRKWQDQSGVDKYTTEVVLRPFRSNMTMLGGASQGQGREEDQRSRQQDNRGNDRNDYDRGGQRDDRDRRSGQQDRGRDQQNRSTGDTNQYQRTAY